jgi:phage-related tail protein
LEKPLAQKKAMNDRLSETNRTANQLLRVARAVDMRQQMTH